MDEFLAELRDLDETQERVEAVSDELLKALRSGNDDDGTLIAEMVDVWIETLRTSDFQSERIAFLYVANHVLQKTLFENDAKPDEAPRIVGLFRPHLEEAVSLVSNSPMDRQSVLRLLELWHEKAIFSDVKILEMWKCTGEDIPEFLAKVAAESDTDPQLAPEAASEHVEDVEADLEQTPAPALPKLNARAANPVLNALKKIDRQKVAIMHLEQSIRDQHSFILTQAPTRYSTPQDLLDDYTTPVTLMKQRVEDCLRLVKTRNRMMQEIPVLKEELKQALAQMIADEKAAKEKNEQRLEQCDMIDIGLADLAEHRDTYPDEWSQEAYTSLERQRRREEEQRLHDEKMARLHQAALAESAAHAMNLEADITGEPTSELRSMAKDYHESTQEAEEEKPQQTNEMVWHPVLKELVPLQSLNLEWESWRDH
ncbi:hypothetical protein Poli38472_001004 [Pythium oligandrum]|uniref:CID domain-containing protein n=1 Tax=Pythium oligandrum TaxID=41045 RepID=A0A8K1FIP5_PYTOL|nr:hypothetical protein Poli38472_001004 [Pythium oligandrum]|eukprot:TMW60962.1 hypothetical protein Poli38472_001004 [Pythium oligandrum]